MMMDQTSAVGAWQHDMYQGMQPMARHSDDVIYSQQPQHMNDPMHGQGGMPPMDMPGMAHHGMDAMGLHEGQPQPMATSASSQMAMLLAGKQMKMHHANSGQLVGKDMVGFVKAKPQMMQRYMKQTPLNSDHVMASSGLPPMSGCMTAGGHMMDDMIDDPTYPMGHMSMMPNAMGGMRPMMAGEQMGQVAAGQMGSSQWLQQQQQQQFQQQQQMRCMPSEYQRYPRMPQQGLGMYGGNLPPQVQRVRMNFQSSMAHAQGFAGDGMMMQYGSMSHIHQQQQQQQMVMNQKRMQMKSQMVPAIRPSNLPPQMSATSAMSQRGIVQVAVEMPQPQQQQQQQPSSSAPQQPALPCSLASSQAGLRPAHGLVKRAPSPRRPPPHYTDTVSMQSMARRMVPGTTRHLASDRNPYGAEHLRFPMGMASDYGSPITAPQMEAVQQFSNGTHSTLPRFPNNMPQ